jgi:hypothetical protein
MILKVLFEVGVQVGHLRAPPAVDRLVGVAHCEEAAGRAVQQADQLVLRAVGVLQVAAA